MMTRRVMMSEGSVWTRSTLGGTCPGHALDMGLSDLSSLP